MRKPRSPLRNPPCYYPIWDWLTTKKDFYSVFLPTLRYPPPCFCPSGKQGRVFLKDIRGWLGQQENFGSERTVVFFVVHIIRQGSNWCTVSVRYILNSVYIEFWKFLTKWYKNRQTQCKLIRYILNFREKILMKIQYILSIYTEHSL